MGNTTTYLHPAKQASEQLKPSQQPNSPIERFDHRSGLSSLQVHMTVISKDGRLWAATPTGLACYDGVTTRIYGRRHGLVNHGLRTLAIHPQSGHLWIGTDLGIQVFDIKDGVPASLWSKSIGTVNALGLHREASYIGCASGLFKTTGTNEFKPVRDFVEAEDTVEKILPVSNGGCWIIGSGSGLIFISLDGEKRALDESHQTIGRANVLANGPGNSILIGGSKGFCRIAPDGKLISRKFLSDAVEALFWNREEIWLACGQTVLSFPIDFDESTPPKPHLNGVSVKHIRSDRFDNIWLSTSGQALLKISSFRNTFVAGFPTETGHVLSIHTDQGERLIGGSNGLVLSDGQVILKDLEIWDILRDHEGKIWCATDKGLICTPNPNLSFSYRHEESRVIQAPCRALSWYKNHLYVASIRGLARRTFKGFEEVLDNAGNALGYVYSLHVGPNNNLWIATLGRGIFRYDGHILSEIELSDMADNSNVYAMTHDASSRMYFAHDDKITRLEPSGQCKTLHQIDGSVAAWSLGWMTGGNLVAGSLSGLIVFDDETGQIKHRISGNFEDVPWEFTTSRSLSIADNSRLYCGLGSGLRTVDLSDLMSKNESPVARLANLIWRNALPEIMGNKVSVAAGPWHLTIEFSTEWFLDYCQMRYQLIGFDQDWSGYQNLGPIVFTSLPAGKYSLAIQLRSNLAGSGPVSHIIDIEVFDSK